MKDFLKQKYVVISVIGPHAGESEGKIFKRKKREIKDTGKSFWLHKSYNAKPDVVQDISKEALKKGNTPLCIFIQASSKKGAQPTKQADRMREFSVDRKNWKKVPSGILVTGSSKNSFIMVFNELDIIERKEFLNLWDYSLFGASEKAVKMALGASTVCCLKESSKDDQNKMKSNLRKVVAVGELTYPFAAWVR